MSSAPPSVTLTPRASPADAMRSLKSRNPLILHRDGGLKLLTPASTPNHYFGPDPLKKNMICEEDEWSDLELDGDHDRQLGRDSPGSLDLTVSLPSASPPPERRAESPEGVLELTPFMVVERHRFVDCTPSSELLMNRKINRNN